MFIKLWGFSMTENVIIQNDWSYLFLQWLGWDYNFWTVIFANIVLAVGFFGIIFVIGFIGMCLDWW